MEKSLIFNSLFVFTLLWGISLVFLLFRPRIEFFWKILPVLVFVFYLWFFWEEIFKGYNAFKAGWYPLTIVFFKELLLLVFYNTFIFWPIALITAFYKSDDMSAERLIKFMCVFTLILWVVLTFYIYNNSGFDKFFFEKLKSSVPFIKH